ncbi:MAG: PD-(D/E)XK nuclease family protein, partial [Candidatus Aenigmatarchaeota archaeon]
QAYCEYQIYLQSFLGVKIRPTQAMREGLKQHTNLYRDFREKATEKGTIQELLQKVKEEGISYSSRELGVVGLASGIYGKIDNIILHPDRIEIVDDKPSERVWSSDVRQVWGYCLAFKENFAPGLPIFGLVQHRDTRMVLFREKLSPGIEQVMRESVIQRMHELILGIRQFEPTQKPEKCRACRFGQRGVCDRSLCAH